MRPFPVFQDRAYERAQSARKRTSAEGCVYGVRTGRRTSSYWLATAQNFRKLAKLVPLPAWCSLYILRGAGDYPSPLSGGEALGPQVTSGLSVNELNVDAHAVPAALNAALEDIADVQVAADLLQIDGFALVRESGAAPDHVQASKPRKIGSQALRDPVDEMLLLGSPPILANGRTTIETRGGTDFSGAGAGASFAWEVSPTSSE